MTSPQLKVVEDCAYCRAELTIARALGKAILPIICAPLGDRYVLPEVQAVDFVDWNEGGLERVAQRLHAITDELARGFRLDPQRSPYPGINAFEAEDAAIFFGRDEETRAIIERLDARRTRGGAPFVVVIGASGAGKSSILKAGVLPQLGRRADNWIVLPTMRPEKAPLEELAKTLAEVRGDASEWRAWRERLAGPGAVREVGELAKDLRVGTARSAIVLLPLDQLEELFTIADRGERDAFLALLAGVLDREVGLPVMAVATGRTDVLQGLLEASPVAALVETVPLLLMPLDRVPRLVAGPAAVASLIVDEGLAPEIAHDVESVEALPLLAQTLRLLYDRCAGDKRLTLATYRSLGDAATGLNPVQNSVRLAADQALATLNPSEAELDALRDAFIPHLVRVRLDDGRRLRQPAPTADLPREAERLVRALTGARLLTTRLVDDGPVVEATHEALFTAWPTLAHWLDEEQQFLIDLERLKSANAAWAETPDRDKPKALLQGLLLATARNWVVQHPRRFAAGEMEVLRAFIAESANADDARLAAERLRRRIAFTAISAGLIVALVLASLTGWQWRAAETQRARAQESLNLATETANALVFDLAQKFRDSGVPIAVIEDVLAKARQLQDQLLSGGEDSPELRRSQAEALIETVDTLLPLGDTKGALAAASKARDIFQGLLAATPNSTDYQRELFVSNNKIGDVLSAEGDLAGALAAYRDSLVLIKALVAKDPSKTSWQYDLGISNERVGLIEQAEGDLSDGLQSFRVEREIAMQLIQQDPNNTLWQRDLAVSDERVGEVLQAQGDLAGALASYRNCQAIAKALAAKDPSNTGWQRDLSVSDDKIGEALSDQGDLAGALASYREGLAIIKALAVKDPGNTEWQRDLAVSDEKTGDVLRAQGDLADALALYRDSLAIRKALVAKDPSNTLWQRDLAVSDEKIADGLRDQGDLNGALATYRDSLAIMKTLAAKDPSNTQWQIGLVVSLYKTALAGGDTKANLIDALTVLKRLDAEGRLTAAQKKWIPIAEAALAKAS
jgi:tetratricopeptide (TPR) repeat protein